MSEYISDDYVKRSDVHKAFQPKYAPAINKTFAAMIDSVPAADVVERPCWIPVTERLPEERDYYLVFTQANETYVCDFIPSVNQWWIEPCDKRLGNVTHWMTIPQPPKEET